MKRWLLAATLWSVGYWQPPPFKLVRRLWSLQLNIYVVSSFPFFLFSLLISLLILSSSFQIWAYILFPLSSEMFLMLIPMAEKSISAQKLEYKLFMSKSPYTCRFCNYREACVILDADWPQVPLASFEIWIKLRRMSVQAQMAWHHSMKPLYARRPWWR